MKAYFAGGCFWCVTPIYKIYGVDKVVCGYSGGDEVNPTYADVKAQKTKHRETIELTYDSKNVTYDKLLDIYLANVDPFDGEGQFIDKGYSYTLAIYYQTDDEKKLALEKINEIEKQSGKKVMIALEKFKSFYEAEIEHQDYYLKNPEAFAKEIEESGRSAINVQHVKETFAEYVKNYNPNDSKIALKISHTYRVADICREIAKSLKMDEEKQKLAWLLGMLHDIGRFEQIREYHTFIDADSVDHAEYGADLLFGKERLIEEYINIRTYDSLIETAIREHNKFRIREGLDENLTQFCNILRDADKIDIFKVNADEPIEGIFETTEAELKKEEISPDAMAQVFEHHAITRDACHTNMDHYLGHLAMAFELVYPRSREIVLEQGYLMQLFDYNSDNPGTVEAIAKTKEEVLKVLGV